MPWLKRMSKSIVITPWGSDVLRVTDAHAIERMCSIYSYASCVTAFPATQLGEAIIKRFTTGVSDRFERAQAGEAVLDCALFEYDAARKICVSATQMTEII